VNTRGFVLIVMNTIPLTFNENQKNITIIGGEQVLVSKIPISVILLNRSGTTFRANNLESLLSYGFTDIISIEAPQQNYNLDEISKRFPSVKFVIPSENLTPGEMINLGMQEVRSKKVLVLWDTMHLSSKVISDRILNVLLNEEVLCFVPFLFTVQMQNLPSKNIPAIENGSFSVKSFTVVQDYSKTLYPFDFVGVYDKDRFINIGGFDYTLVSSYWQLLDFALRGYLWGEKIIISSGLRLNYECEVSLEDTTPDSSQLRFFLKNLCPKILDGVAHLPNKEFFSYFNRSSLGLFEALKTFSMAKKWVSKNKYRFKTDAQKLIVNWDSEDE